MRLLIDSYQSVGRDFGINLRRHERRVTEKLLNHPKIGARFEHVCRTRVPQHVRAHHVAETNLLGPL